jgi:hypothetical protein
MKANSKHSGPAADLLGFLESCGFRFELTDQGVAMRMPPLLRCMAAQVNAVLPAIRVALEARAARPTSAAAARKPTKLPMLGEPALLHRRRGEWDAYVYVGQLHAIFAGTATNEGEARQAAREKFAAVSRSMRPDAAK